MAVTAAKLVVEIGADASEAEKALAGMSNKLRDWSGTAVAGLSVIGSTLVTGGLAAAGIGAAGLAAGLVSSTKAAMDAENIQAQLNAVLQSTQGAAGMTAQAVNDLANSLSLVTPFEDDAIVAGENMLLTFTNIGKDVFPGATEAMLDMSQALGQDMQSSAMQLGKALNDPIVGVTALRRVGVNLTDAQQDLIKAMVESGDVAGAQKLILKELQVEFGGSAKAAGETFAGKLEILKNSLGNIQETIGSALLPVLSDLATQFSQYLADPAVQAGIAAIAQALGEMASQAVAYLPQVVELIRGAFGWLMENQGVIAGVLAVIGASIAAFVYTTVLPALGAMIAASWPVVAVMALIGGAAYLLYEAWTNNWGGIRDILTDVWNNNLKPAFDQLVSWLQTNIPVAIKVLSDFWNNTLLPALQAFWGFLSTYVIPLVGALANVWLALLKKEFEIVAGIVMNVVVPYFENLWKVVQIVIDKLQPLWSWLAEKLKPAFKGIGDAVLDVIGWLGELATTIGNLQLPDWLTPGSPTPFEMGLRGIASAMSDVNRVGLPAFGLGNGIGASGGGSNGGMSIGNISITINGNADAGVVRSAVQEGVLRAARSMGMVVA